MMDSQEEGKEMQRQTLYLQSIAASLLVLTNNTVGIKDDGDRANQRQASLSYLAAEGDDNLVGHSGVVHVSYEEYNAWSEFWVAAWDAVEVKESATPAQTLRYTAAFGSLQRIVGTPNEHRTAKWVTP